MSENMVLMPRKITAEMIKALSDDPTTQYSNAPGWYEKLGWLMCAWDVLVAQAESARTAQPEPAAEPDGWVAWGGGDCPVAPDIVVEVHLADDYFSTDRALVFDWTHDCDDRNIIAYRVVQS